MPEPFAYVKFNSTGIIALICSKCLTTYEKMALDEDPHALIPIYEPGAVICKRCREVAK